MPFCDRTGCGKDAVVQWRRRSPDDPTHVLAVFACHGDAIHVDAAALVHDADCPAPDPVHLPACGCTPEPAPLPDLIGADMVTLPTGWTVPAP